MKKSVTAMVLACALVVGGVGLTPAGAAESSADVCYSVSIDKSSIVAADTRTEMIGFKELSTQAVDPAVLSESKGGSMTRATSRIEWDIPSGKIMKADTAYSLEADEVVTINCTYSPRTADLDFGFITPDNTFHFTSGSEGSIKTNIQIEDTGKYYFAVRNNTKNSVEVLGYVYY